MPPPSFRAQFLRAHRGNLRMNVDEGLFVSIHGADQWVTIRGRDTNNPVLLLISGAGAAFSAMAPLFAAWERDFSVVQWDQPAAGATHARNGARHAGELTVERLARDGIAVTQFVCERLGTEKVVLIGISGGSMVGLRMVKQRPDLFCAYVGSGQIVDWARQDAASYRMVLAQARAADNPAAVAELQQLGPPPYADAATDAIKSKYASAMTPAERAAFGAVDPAVMAAVQSPQADARYIAKDLKVSDVRTLAMAAYTAMRDEIVAFDARRLGLDFDVPMFFFQGDHDAYTVTSEVQVYESEIRAPKKMLVVIEGGGHSCLMFMRDEFLALLVRFVRPLATQKPR